MTQPTPPAISGYRLSRLLGTGATARVYLARPEEGTRLAAEGVRKVALKVLLPPDELEANPAAADMFANEVRLTLQLRHPNLVRGYDGKGRGEGAYLALEYLPGGALSDLLLPGHLLPPEQALTLLLGVARGLKYMHAEGAVHQDIKPQNVYLDGERALLADFGAAYMQGQGGKAGGSPFYMAPEIYRGEEGTPASDIYSLSVLTYELLGGRRPLTGEDYSQLMYEHLNTMPPSLLVLNSEAPRGLAKLAQHGLAKAQDARPEIGEFVAELESVLGAQVPAVDAADSGVKAGPVLGRAPVAGTEDRSTQASQAEVQSPEELNLTQKAGALVSRLNPFKRGDN